MTGTRTVVASLAVTGLLLVAAVGSAAAAPESSMTVTLAGDGSAKMVVTSTFDLDSADEQAAFDELQSDESAREAHAARFEDRLQTIADSTEAATGREMAVTDVSIALSREDSTGIVDTTATWDGLAAVDGDQLTLSEPFASEFTIDRQFVVVLPEGYELATTTPEPASTADGRVVYASGTSLDGFELVTASSDSTAANDGATGDDATGESGPGFGVVAAVAALVAAGLPARRL
jgi:PGF-CTERM protein